MNRVELCCHELDTLDNAQFSFSKMLVYEYYDGPVSGAIACEECGVSYKFTMLDWDENQDIRIFSLAILSPESFRQLIEVCSQGDTPHWPTWVPKWNFPSEASRAEAYSEAAQILARAEAVAFVIAWNSLDDKILAARTITPEDKFEVQSWSSWESSNMSQDWFHFMNLSR